MSDQINFRPWFEQGTVPCEGEVGDIIVITPSKEGKDRTAQGDASVWFCVKAQAGERPAVWAHVLFDGIASCADGPVKEPSQTLPTLRKG
jgi:hypothetical protein